MLFQSTSGRKLHNFHCRIYDFQVVEVFEDFRHLQESAEEHWDSKVIVVHNYKEGEVIQVILNRKNGLTSFVW